MKDIPQQLADNSNRIALMSAIIAAGTLANSNNRGDIDGHKIAIQSVGLAMAIQDEINKVAEQVRREL